MDEKSSFPNNPSTETQRGVKTALQSWQACKYVFFLSDSADRRASDGVWQQCEGASVSTTRISKSIILRLPNTTDSQVSFLITVIIIRRLPNNCFMVHWAPNQSKQISKSITHIVVPMSYCTARNFWGSNFCGFWWFLHDHEI